MKLIGANLLDVVSVFQGHQLSSADVWLFNRGWKQPGENKQGKCAGLVAPHRRSIYIILNVLKLVVMFVC